jgi:hypothetical protein
LWRCRLLRRGLHGPGHLRWRRSAQRVRWRNDRGP